MSQTTAPTRDAPLPLVNDTDVALGVEQQNRPRDIDDGNHWLECDAAYPGARVADCTGFAGDGRSAFVRDVVTRIH